MTTYDGTPITAGRLVAGRYRLHDRLGQGGMGTVWRADDELLRRPVAVKEVYFPPSISDEERAVLRERTMREARAAARLDSPSAVRVYDVVEDGDHPCIVMELVDGRTLSEVIRADGPLPPARAAEVGLAVLDALIAAHAAGIVHRDVKPGNVLLRTDGRVTLSDFGIARSAEDPSLTSTGLLLGSPAYIAPERARGQRPEPASDLWSLGATLYTAMEGRPPFDRGEPFATLTAVVSEPPQPFTAPGPLSEVITALLRKDPFWRMTAPEARAALRAVIRETAGQPGVATDPRQRPVEPETGGRTIALPVSPASPLPPPSPAATRPVTRPTPAPQPTRLAPPPRPPAGAATSRTVTVRRPGGRRTPAVVVLLLLGLLGAAVVAATAHRGGSPDRRTAGSSAAAGGPASSGTSPGAGSASGGSGSSTGSGGNGSGGSTGTGTGSGTGSATGSSGTGSTAGSTGGLPTGFVTYRDPAVGWSLAHPTGWTVQHHGTQLDIVDPAGGRYIRVDTKSPADASAVGDWRALEASFRTRHSGYQRIRLETISLAGYSDAADWEFTYTAGGSALHALDRGLVNGGRGYAVYFQTRSSAWDASAAIRAAVYASFRPAG